MNVKTIENVNTDYLLLKIFFERKSSWLIDIKSTTGTSCSNHKTMVSTTKANIKSQCNRNGQKGNW